MDETRQNPGENVAAAHTPEPGAVRGGDVSEGRDVLEHVLDAWSAEPSTRSRYDRLRLERRDGESLEVLIDSDTARDLGDKLTITAARARHRTRGASGVPVDTSIDPGDAEDLARARKVMALFVFTQAFADSPTHRDDVNVRVLAEEFKASREDVAKAHAMLDEQRTKHISDMAAIAKRHVEADEAMRGAFEAVHMLEVELASVKADRANLIAEAAQRDIEDGERGEGHASIDLSDPSEPAPP